MVSLNKAFHEWIYSLSTKDKYSDFDSTKSFNRLNKPTEAQVLLHHENLSHHDLSLVDPQLQQGIHEVKLAWHHIKNWLQKNSQDLNSSLQHRCTADDLSDFQKDLDIRLPPCVEEFYQLTDGQLSDDFNAVGGLVFGLKLMSLDEIVVMTQHWRQVAKKLTMELSRTNNITQLPKVNHHRSLEPQQLDLAHANDSSATLNLESSKSATKYPKQMSIPPGAIHAIFAHPSWIPLITDEVGNCIGIDLSPPSDGPGKYGQVILFGREFDTKFLLADNWGDFLLIFANDLEKGNWDIKEPVKNNYGDLMMGKEGDLVFIDRDSQLEINYLTVLKQRCITKWIESLDTENVPQETKDLIAELKKSDSILNLKNLNDKSLDTFINKNLGSMLMKPEEDDGDEDDD